MAEMFRSIELKQLLALRAVAETGTFWQAAERVHAAHSTLSDHIAALKRSPASAWSSARGGGEWCS